MPDPNPKPPSQTNPDADARAVKSDGPRAGKPLKATPLDGPAAGKDPVKEAQRKAATSAREGRVAQAEAQNEAAAARVGEDPTDYASFLDEMTDEDFDATDNKVWSDFVTRLKSEAKDPMLGKLNRMAEPDRATEANRIRSILEQHVHPAEPE